MRCRNKSLFGVKAVFLTALLVLCVLTPDAAAQTDTDIKHSLKQARKLTRAGLVDEAETLMRRAVAGSPETSAAKVELAYILAKQRKIGEAYDLVLSVAKAEPQNARAFSVLGYILLASGRFGDTRAVLENALAIDRSDDLAWATLGRLDFYENKIDRGILGLKEAVFQDPFEPDHLLALAQACVRAEDYRGAADSYYKFLSISKDTDKERRDRIKGLIEFLRFLGDKAGIYTSAHKDSTVVRFDLVNNRPVIQLKVNGKSEALNFVLDTGSGISVMSEKAAARLKIRPVTRGGFGRGIGGNGKFEIVYGYLNSIEIGDVKIKNIPIYIRKFHDQNERIDGYIGLSLISRFITKIDYGRQTFSITRQPDADEQPSEENNTVSLPLRLTSSGFLSGEVLLKDVEAPLNFIVDTGASLTVISAGVGNLESIKGYLVPGKLRIIGSAGVTENASMYVLPKVSFGSYSRDGVEAVALDLGVINETSGFEQSGILGGNFLRNYAVTFDFKNSKVFFDPISPAGPQ